MDAGALNLASPEVKIQMDSAESSDPIDVKQKEQLETNSLVEEFMLLANISVARKIQEVFPLTAVLRWVLYLDIKFYVNQSIGVMYHLLLRISKLSKTYCTSARA